MPDKADVMPLVLTNAAIFAALLRIGHADSAKELLLTLAVSLLVSGVVVPAFVCWLNWIRSPYALEVQSRADMLERTGAELEAVRKERDGLAGTVKTSGEQRKATYVALTTICGAFQNLCSKSITSQDDFDSWSKEWAAIGLALALLQKVLKPHEWQSVSYVKWNPKQNYVKKFNDEHGQRWLEGQARIQALQALAERYAD